MSIKAQHFAKAPAARTITSTHCQRYLPVQSRRDFLRHSALGFGASILGLLMAQDADAVDGKAGNLLAPKEPHFSAKAQRVIFFFAGGGPSHLETFDPKPALTKYNGQPIPESFKTEGLSLQFMKASDGKLMASPFPFRRSGSSGLEISEVFSRDRKSVV